MDCRFCGATWCYEGDHEPGQRLPRACPQCRCTTPNGHPVARARFASEADALRVIRTCFTLPLEAAYPCGSHWHITSQVRPGIRLTRRGKRHDGAWLTAGQAIPAN